MPFSIVATVGSIRAFDRAPRVTPNQAWAICTAMRRGQTISAILITKDEESNISGCIASLAFCDEVVVVDGGSSDHTVRIARDAGAAVHVIEDWQGFGPQKQRALDLASSDWVLSIDADERVPEALCGEIERAVESDRYAGYYLNRVTWFLGQRMRHGAMHPDRIVRLARRDKARFTPALVHEALVVDGALGALEEPLLHYSYRTIDDAMRKLHHYVVAAAESKRREKRMGGLSVAILRSTYAFLKSYVLQAGFLDGRRGYVASVLVSQMVFWRYVGTGWERD